MRQTLTAERSTTPALPRLESLAWATAFLGLGVANTTLAVVLWLATTARHWRDWRAFAYRNRYALGLLLTGMLGSLTAPNPTIAFLTTVGYGLILLVTLNVPARLLAQQHTLAGAAELDLLKYTALGAVITVMSASHAYFFTSAPRATSFATGANGLGTLTIIIAAFMFALLEQGGIKRCWYALPVLAGAVFTSAISFSRGGWLGLLAMTGVYAYRSRYRKWIAVMLICLLLVSLTSPPILRRAKTIFSLERNQDRIVIWKASWQMFLDHPILGVGPGNFPFTYPEYRLPEARQRNHPFAHNLPLQILVEFGLVGLVFFSLLMYEVFNAGLFVLQRDSAAFYRACFAAFAGVFVHQMVDCTVYGFELGGAFWLLAGFVLARRSLIIDTVHY